LDIKANPLQRYVEKVMSAYPKHFSFWKLSLCWALTLLTLSCHTKPSYDANPQLSKKLEEKGYDLLTKHYNLLQAKDSLKAEAAMKKAFQQFRAAYNADTTNLAAACMVGNCYFYQYDLPNGIYWFEKVLAMDTIKPSRASISEKVGYYYIFLGQLQKAIAYYQDASKVWGNRDSLLADEFASISDEIYYGKDTKLVASLDAKGIDHCNYSIEILKYSYSLFNKQSFLDTIQKRMENCH
jgi:tetratricopeptide (TPR) repeat protein